MGRERFREQHVVIRAGEHVLICGTPGEGKTPLFRALSGLWPWGSGRIVRPRGESFMYVPRGTPYLPRGTLREVLAYPLLTDRFAERAYVQALERTGLARYAKSLDATQRWDRELREDDQMALALARVALHAPDWVVFDDTFSAMEDETLERVIDLFTNDLTRTTIIHIGRSTQAHLPLFSRVLHLTRIERRTCRTRTVGGRTPAATRAMKTPRQGLAPDRPPDHVGHAADARGRARLRLRASHGRHRPRAAGRLARSRRARPARLSGR